MVDPTMDALTWLRKQLETDCPDLARAMLERFAEQLMSAEADALCGAGYGERSPERVTKRNGYRSRRWDTRAGTIELEIPKLRAGTYFPDWLLVPHAQGAHQLVHPAGGDPGQVGVGDGHHERLLGPAIEGISRSQVSEMPGAWTRRSRPSAPGRSPAPTPTSGWTRSSCAAATTASA